MGRLAVLKDYRGESIGRAIMLQIQAELDSRGMDGVMHAQSHLESWYAALGWSRVGQPFIEADIKHIKMRYTPENSV